MLSIFFCKAISTVLQITHNERGKVAGNNIDWVLSMR